MILAITDVLTAADVEEVRSGFATAPFVDGRATAGWSARLVKSNLQASPAPEVERLRALVETRLRDHPVFALATRPKTILGPLFSRYQPGHAYGAHVDDALMGGVRSDISFTLFLSDPASYDGGELVIDSTAGEEAFKLAPGSVITYPATTLHRVVPVTSGERLAAAGWVRSFIRDAGRRELLFDLDTARRRMFARDGKGEDYDLVSKSLANLLRMWAED
jgi:PKHD-type hydroxylase